MILSDKQLDKLMKELGEILIPKQIQQIQSHMSSILREFGRLRTSRDMWRKRAEEKQ